MKNLLLKEPLLNNTSLDGRPSRARQGAFDAHVHDLAGPSVDVFPEPGGEPGGWERFRRDHAGERYPRDRTRARSPNHDQADRGVGPFAREPRADPDPSGAAHDVATVGLVERDGKRVRVHVPQHRRFRKKQNHAVSAPPRRVAGARTSGVRRA